MRAVGLVVLGLLVAGCGSPRAYPPTGVDGLTIPTPSPRPADFVSSIRNPWFPLGVRGRWVYAVEPTGTRILTVIGHGRVDGVPTTRLRTSPGGAVDDFAQDRAGNVWWFAHRGNDGSWAAGVDGAQAGLAVPAHPRLGDGFRMAYRKGRVEDIGTVVAVDAHEVTIDVSSPLEPGAVTRLVYQPGGLVSRIVAASGETDTLQ